jgi:FtsH-binding integral membrane protein
MNKIVLRLLFCIIGSVAWGVTVHLILSDGRNPIGIGWYGGWIGLSLLHVFPYRSSRNKHSKSRNFSLTEMITLVGAVVGIVLTVLGISWVSMLVMLIVKHGAFFAFFLIPALVIGIVGLLIYLECTLYPLRDA